MGKINPINAPRQANFQEEEEAKKQEQKAASPLKELTNNRKQGASKHTFSMSQSEWEFLQYLANKLNNEYEILLGDLEKTTPSELIRWGLSYLIQQKQNLNIDSLIEWRKQKYENAQNLNDLLSQWKR